MADFIKVGKTSEISDGNIKRFEVGEKQIVVVNLEGKFFALDDKCTHKGCLLSKGHLEGENIVCPCHGGQFDLKSGEVKKGPPTEAEKVYELKIENDDILLKI